MSIAKSLPNILSPFGAELNGQDMTTAEVSDRLFRGKLLLAPMVRANTLPFRLLALQYGADTVYTEELVDRKFASGKVRREVNQKLGTVDFVEDVPWNRRTRAKMGLSKADVALQQPLKRILLRISPTHERGRLIFQIGTNNSARALKAAKLVIDDVAGIDVNMGCPKHFSVHSGMGAGLLKTPDLACDIIKTLRDNLPSNKTVSCKIRLLDLVDMKTNIDFLQRLEAAGADAIAVHFRVLKEGNNDPAHWDMVRQLSKSINIPFIANGDILDGNCAHKIRKMATTNNKKTVSLMMARGALRNCSIFRASNIDNKEVSNNALVPLDDVVCDYLKLSVLTENVWRNTKYCVQQMFKWNGLLKTERGKHINSSRSFQELSLQFNFKDTTLIDVGQNKKPNRVEKNVEKNVKVVPNHVCFF